MTTKFVRAESNSIIALRLFDLVEDELDMGIYTTAAEKRLPLPKVIIDTRHRYVIAHNAEVISQLKAGWLFWQAEGNRAKARRFEETKIDTIMFQLPSTDEDLEFLIKVHGGGSSIR